MSDSTPTRYLRTIDTAALEAADPSQRYTQKLIDAPMGAQCTISYIRTEVGGGSPEGLHTHEVDQIFYTLAGTMQVEIDGQKSSIGPGSAVLFPAGIPHQNWNDGPEPTIHLNICSPVPDPSKPFARRVGS